MIRIMIHFLGNFFRQFRLFFLRKSGIKIGNNTMISLGAKLDLRRGEIQIGDNCLITHGCYILSHDGAAHVIDEKDKGDGKVIIGDNVFIGVNTVVLRNVTIGDNVVIGAGSVVNKDIPSGSLAVGNPAKVIKSLSKPYIDLIKEIS